jgi:hypothetical protein
MSQNQTYDRPREYLTQIGREPVDHVPKDKDSPNKTFAKREAGQDFYLMHAGAYDAPRELEVNERHIVPNPAYDRWLKGNSKQMTAKFSKGGKI